MAFITRLSRFRFCLAVQRNDGTMMLTDREPFRYVPFDDNTIHPASRGDTWRTLAGRYFKAENIVVVPERLWWVIADFQPQPVVDPTLRIQPGTLIHIPTLTNVFQHVFNEDRRVLHR